MENKIKVVFCGTPKIGADVLKALIEMNQVEVILVISQPDKPIGRKKEIVYTPVKKLALENNLKVVQPNKIGEIYDDLAKLEFDFLITCAFGQFIPAKILKLAKTDSINFHGSLLPKLRGGAPIQYAIKNGDKKTGITIMQMVKQMDAGDYYVQESIDILDSDDSGSLFEKMGQLAYSMCKKYLVDIYNRKFELIKQNENEVTFCKNISSEEEKINWNNTSLDIFNLIRSLSPSPISYTTINSQRYKIKSSKIINLDNQNKNVAPGTIIDINKQGIVVKTLDSSLLILEIQKEGKKMILASNYYLNKLSDLKINDKFD
ncbi:methionyl-tRNA formyltransferase [Mycoplasma capricolum subsp. capricolum]|uniref:methionyl-tRNA formyltransferase n=1 Tax=Mycoplasma capricolum TaxID=2095 RepID=UPI0020BE0BBD|nr:methionyl-tRNA formyltransferase [Mycoplasma capricolum]MCK8461727.1 methionyl-tRNA formyltransferase [Mycoplasma capricolum subsp. capricolum]